MKGLDWLGEEITRINTNIVSTEAITIIHTIYAALYDSLKDS